MPKDVKGFVFNWFTSDINEWLMQTLEMGYTNGKKHIFPFDELDWSIREDSVNLTGVDRCIDSNHAMFQTYKYVWFKEKVAPKIGDCLNIEIEYDNMAGVRNKVRAFLGRPNPCHSVKVNVEVTEQNYFQSPQGSVAVKLAMPRIFSVQVVPKEE